MLEKNNKTNKKGAGWEVGGFISFISFIFKFFLTSLHLTSGDNIFHPFDLPILLLLFVCLLFCLVFVSFFVVVVLTFCFVLTFLSWQTKYELVHNGACTRAATVVEGKTSTTDRNLSPRSLLRRLSIR